MAWCGWSLAPRVQLSVTVAVAVAVTFLDEKTGCSASTV